jgi:hypothetical protein
MTNQQHPITPPPELVQQWYDDARDASVNTPQIEKLVATRAAQWGADQELEACCDWLEQNCDQWKLPYSLRAARRPKPPSLKEQALKALRHAPGPDCPNPITLLTADEHALIRQALEQLDD